MMNTMFVLLVDRAFSDVIEGMKSRSFLLTPLPCSKPAIVYMNNASNL